MSNIGPFVKACAAEERLKSLRGYFFLHAVAAVFLISKLVPRLLSCEPMSFLSLPC